MAKKTDPNNTDALANYLDNLEHPLKNVLLELQLQILSKFPEISAQSKWNSLSLYYNGEMKPFNPKEYKRDLVVINLNKREYILLVFPTGSKIKDNNQVLEGDYPDGRRMLKINSIEDLNNKMTDLQLLIQFWIAQIE
ncbi:MAG TPA: DUF1801 domain-containing protein [Saprospiraceae bacterium]|nr:DUF1801 domain-containing protein [Saprospiraceae bacterium]